MGEMRFHLGGTAINNKKKKDTKPKKVLTNHDIGLKTKEEDEGDHKNR